MDPDTPCTNSSHFKPGRECSNAYDGNIEPGRGKEWVSLTANGEWIKIIFRTYVQLIQLELWHRCNVLSQARNLKLEFSNASATSVNRTCDGSNNYRKCTGQARAIIVDWPKITATRLCQPESVWFL
ncbi:hypothetical protein LSH36_351g00026 [Paralvinella palmiformis]|uniref:DUF7402 domain-containing protein n=1 Tax=Paralvinella palmiformis TaxID=53620 RepID=A0AAD9N1P1_9ANNE|nr:hypothetical protein LSH36_351g00026 [Paralvinella palmiformis]